MYIGGHKLNTEITVLKNPEDTIFDFKMKLWVGNSLVYAPSTCYRITIPDGKFNREDIFERLWATMIAGYMDFADEPDSNLFGSYELKAVKSSSTVTFSIAFENGFKASLEVIQLNVMTKRSAFSFNEYTSW